MLSAIIFLEVGMFRSFVSTFVFIFMSISMIYGVQTVYAQDTVDVLSDLVGAKAGQAENAVEQRGYTYVKTEKSGNMSFSYWRESGSNKCVSIKTEDGRYQAIVYAMDFDCQKQESSATKYEPVSATVDGHCKLYNTKSDNNKYKGSCTIKQKMSNDSNKYVIKLGNGDTYKFIEQSNGYQVETPEGTSKNIATMTDKGDKAVFKWGKWKLTASASNSSQNDIESETVNSAESTGQGDFDATGKIPCAQAKGQPMGQCPFGVSREGNGTATVSVTLPDGRKRAIFFENGKAVSADLSQADGNMDFESTKESGLYMINAGNERYEIPEEVIYGG